MSMNLVKILMKCNRRIKIQECKKKKKKNLKIAALTQKKGNE